MNCEEALDLLVVYLYGELHGERAEALRSHLAQCPKCAVKLDGLSSVRRLVRSREDPTPSPLVIQRLVAEAREDTSRARTFWGLGWLKAAIPLCFMVAVGGWIALHHSASTGRWDRTVGPQHEDAVETPSRQERDPAEPETSGSAGTKAESGEEESERSAGRFRKEELEDKAGEACAFKTPRSEEVEPPGVATRSGAGSMVSGGRLAPAIPSEAPLPQRPQVVSQPPRGPPQQGVADTSWPAEARVEGKGTGGPSEDVAAGKPEKNVRQALASKPQSRQVSPGGLRLAQALLKAEDYEAAEDAFSRAVGELEPGDPQLPMALLGLAEAKEGLGKVEEAIALYMRLERDFPEYRDRAAERVKAIRHGGAVPP
ncbi:MAG: zf-HC2 domain-containing protein [Thermodesulfobacteriota bacterium]